MRKTRILFVITGVTALLAGGCASVGQPVQLTTPATDRTKAMDCVLAEADARGYQPTSGSSVTVGGTSAVILLTKNRGFQAGEAGKEAAARIASMGLKGVNSATDDGIRASIAGGNLRLFATSLYENNKWGKPTDQALADTHAVLGACGGMN